MSRDRLFRVLDTLQGRKQNQRRVINAVLGMGDQNETVEVSGRPGYHWVRLYGSTQHVIPALNRTTSGTYGLPVQVAVSTDFRTGRREYEVIGLADNDILTSGGSVPFDPYTPEHAASHEWTAISRGRDVVSVYPRAFGFGRVYPTTPASMRCGVSPIKYAHQTDLRTYAGGYTKDFTSDVPSGTNKAMLVLVVLDGATNALDYVDGDEFLWTGYTDPIPAAAVPDPAAGQLVLTCLILYNGMTTITEANFKYEYRLPFATLPLEWGSEDLDSGSAQNGYVLCADGSGGVEWRIMCVVSADEPTETWAGMLWLDISEDIVLGTEDGGFIGAEDGSEIGVE